MLAIRATEEENYVRCTRVAIMQPSVGVSKKRRVYACAHTGCTKSFAKKWNLQAHERLHTGEKPFVCRLGCGARLMWSSSLKTHETRKCSLLPPEQRSKKRGRTHAETTSSQYLTAEQQYIAAMNNSFSNEIQHCKESNSSKPTTTNTTSFSSTIVESPAQNGLQNEITTLSHESTVQIENNKGGIELNQSMLQLHPSSLPVDSSIRFIESNKLGLPLKKRRRKSHDNAVLL